MNAGEAHEIASTSLVIRPNRSLPVAGMVLLFVLLSVQAAVIATAFAVAGAWMILPFAGIEIAIAGALSLWIYRHRDDGELVVVEADSVQVVKRWGNGTRQYEFPRYWVRMRLDRRSGQRDPARLWIGSHGKFVSLGDHIMDGERARVAEALRRLLQS